MMVRCDGGEEGRPARRARGGSAPARSWWRGAACGGGRERATGLARSSWDRFGEVRRHQGTADVGEGPRRGDRVGRRLVAAWRQFVTTATEDGGVVPDLDGETEDRQLGESTRSGGGAVEVERAMGRCGGGGGSDDGDEGARTRRSGGSSWRRRRRCSAHLGPSRHTRGSGARCLEVGKVCPWKTRGSGIATP